MRVSWRRRPGASIPFTSTGDAEADYADIWPLALAAAEAAHRGDSAAWARYGRSLKEDLPVDWRIGLLAWVLMRASVETLHGSRPSPADLDELSLSYAEPFAAATGLSHVYLRHTLYLAYAYSFDEDITPTASADALGLAVIGVIEDTEDLQAMWSEFSDWYTANADTVHAYATEHRAQAEARMSD